MSPAPRVAVLATGSRRGEIGGAERFYAGLRDAIEEQGVDAELVSAVSDESSIDSIKWSYLRFYDLDLSRFDGVISTKAPGYVIQHRNHVCYLQHTMRVFYDMFDVEFPQPSPELIEFRNVVQKLDTAALIEPRVRRRFVIGREVQERLQKFNGLSSEVMHQASNMSGFWTGDYRYIFLPGRLHRWKRVKLVIDAMRFVGADVDLVISGTGEDEAELREAAGEDHRIRFVGRVTDDELLDLYANALVVPFVAYREDFGLVTLEAFHSKKPVITCADSGEPANLVRDGVTGFVCPPDAVEIGARLDWFLRNPDKARQMGIAGAQSIATSSWTAVARRLIEALGFQRD